VRSIRNTAIAVVAALALAACGSSGGDASTAPQGSADVKGSAPAALPGKLPTITPDTFVGEDGLKAIKEILSLAEQHAVGIPSTDRNPTVTVVDSNPCHLYMVAGACLPMNVADAKKPIVIEVNPDEVLTQYKDNFNHSQSAEEGNATWQSEVLGAYINYLMESAAQRTDPSLLTSNDDADIPKIKALQYCKQGNVVGPLREAMSPALWSKFAPLADNEDFVKGTKGTC